MRVGNYSVLIPEGVERETGHVRLAHGTQYTLHLQNHDHRQCDAEVTIDGKAVGGFRLYGHGQVVLERMPDDTGRLTYYSAGTAEAVKADVGAVAAPDRGLIQVRFVPEKQRQPAVHRTTLQARGMTKGGGGPMGMCSFGPQAEEKTSSGITGLSGHSSQKFVTVPDLDRDEAGAVTITVRLVTFDSGPRPLRAAVPERANPVPVPVGD